MIVKHALSILFILTIQIPSIKTETIYHDASVRVIPDWIGTFLTTNECNTQTCCCISGLITLSKMKPNYLRIVSQVEGYNCPSNRKIDSTVTMPTGFKTEIFLMNGMVDITLDSDSRVIKLYNNNAPECSGGAVRNSARSIISIDCIQMLLIISSVFIGKNLLQ